MRKLVLTAVALIGAGFVSVAGTAPPTSVLWMWLPRKRSLDAVDMIPLYLEPLMSKPWITT